MPKTSSPAAAQKSPPLTFRTQVLQTGAQTTGLQIPAAIIEKLGAGKRPLVRVTLNNYTYRGAIATMDGKFMLSLSAAHRQAAGVQGGEAVEVTLELDLEPRTVELPSDFQAALDQAGAFAAFGRAAPSMQKEYVRQVTEAKAPATRERRIAKIIEKLTER